MQKRLFKTYPTCLPIRLMLLLRWAGNRVSLASDRRDVMLMVSRRVDGRLGYVHTNQLDDASLEAAVRAAERQLTFFGSREPRDFTIPAPAFTYPTPAIWSDATFGVMTEARARLVRAVIAPAEAQRMRSAGYLEMRGTGTAVFQTATGPLRYAACTQAQCSMTVRDAKGAGSGWAGLSSYDWAAIDPNALAERALEKATASRDPVALEPGRYTVVLEPQAVHDLVSLLLPMFDRDTAEQGGGPFAAMLAGHEHAAQAVFQQHGQVFQRVALVAVDLGGQWAEMPFAEQPGDLLPAALVGGQRWAPDDAHENTTE